MMKEDSQSIQIISAIKSYLFKRVEVLAWNVKHGSLAKNVAESSVTFLIQDILCAIIQFGICNRLHLKREIIKLNDGWSSKIRQVNSSYEPSDGIFHWPYCQYIGHLSL